MTENSSESGGGSFDALGAFHGGGVFSDEEGEDSGHHPQESRPRRVSESNSFKSSNNIKPSASAGSISGSHLAANRPAGISALGKEKARIQGHQLDDESIEAKKIHSPIKSASTSDIKKSIISNTAMNKSVPDGKPQKMLQQQKPSVEDIKMNSDSLSSRTVVDETKKLDTEKVNSPSRKLPQKQPQHQQQPILQNLEIPESKANAAKQQQKSEFELDGMEEADAFVSKLMADESFTRKGMPSVPNPPPAGIDANIPVKEKWFYRDPQVISNV